MKRLPDEVIDELLPDLCASLACREMKDEQGVSIPPESAIVDVLGLPWCAECTHRRALINWGMARDWPALVYGNYALAEGQDFYTTTVLHGDDERVCALLAAAEEYEKSEVPA